MKKIFIISHNSSIDGPIDYLEKFLRSQGADVYTLVHPLNNYANRYTTLSHNGKDIKKIKRTNLGILNLFLDFIISICFLLRYSRPIIICANNFDTFSALLTKKVFCKHISKIIYFGSDFSEERFHNHILNKIYYAIESYDLKYADLTISNTQRAYEKRKILGLIESKGIIIPNGVTLKEPVFISKDIKKDKFIYIGSVTKEHGLYDFIDTISPIIKELIIIGHGDEWERVVNLCKKKKIKLETFYKKDNTFVINYLRTFDGIGLAPYNLRSKWTYYCSPLKVNEYIACGVPVIISSVPEISKYISDKGLGIVFKNIQLEEIEKELARFNTEKFSLKAEEFYKSFSHDFLYKKLNLIH